MRQSYRVRELVECGDVVLGARAGTNSLVFVDVYGEMGLDFVFINTEHTGASPMDSPSLQQFARAADAAGTEISCISPRASRPRSGMVLYAGIRNLLIPRAETVGDVKGAVKAARFEYDGAAREPASAGPIPTPGAPTPTGIRRDRTGASSSAH